MKNEERETKKTSRKNLLWYKYTNHAVSISHQHYHLLWKNWKKNEIVYRFWCGQFVFMFILCLTFAQNSTIHAWNTCLTAWYRRPILYIFPYIFAHKLLQITRDSVAVVNSLYTYALCTMSIFSLLLSMLHSMTSEYRIVQ